MRTAAAALAALALAAPLGAQEHRHPPPADSPAPATIAAAWDALVDRYPVLAPGRSSVRFARNGTYADASEPLADGDEVAMIPPVSGGANESRILELREEPFEAGILESLTARLATPEDGAVVGFLGITRVSPGTPAPGQETEGEVIALWPQPSR